MRTHITAFIILSGFLSSYINFFKKNEWDNTHFIPDSTVNLKYPEKHQNLISVHAFTIMIAYFIMVEQIFLKNILPKMIHKIIGYFSLLWLPITYSIGTMVIIIRPINVPWMGMSFALMNMIAIITSYYKGILAIFRKQYKLHQFYMEDCFCLMAAPAYLRILYQLNSDKRYNGEEICLITNRGFMIGIIMVIILSRIQYKMFRCFSLLLIYYLFENELLFGCNMKSV